MRYALFLGCTIPIRSRHYEMSARCVAEALGIELVDIDSFICCGFPVKFSDTASAVVMGAYNIAIAAQNQLDICTLCSSCALQLKETVYLITQSPAEKKRINKQLSKIDLQCTDTVNITHFSKLLYQNFDMKAIKSHIKRKLSNLKIAVHCGCHYLKDPFNNCQAENRKSVEDFISATGAQVENYPSEDQCCGGPVLAIDEGVALSAANEKLDLISQSKADALCVVCPFCAVMFDSNQRAIESTFGVQYRIPVLFLTQILGLAFGYDSKTLGFNINAVKTKSLLSKL